MPTYHLDIDAKRNESWVIKNIRLRTDYLKSDKGARKTMKKAAKHFLVAGNYDKVVARIKRADKKQGAKVVTVKEFILRKK